MTYAELHVLERKPQGAYGARRVAPLLRQSMDDMGVTAKELARELAAWAALDPANRQALDYRTIQNAAGGVACALETYLTLSGFFGWGFIEAVQAPIVGADQLTALEIEIERERVEIATREALLNRRLAAARARGSVAGGALRLVPEEARAWNPSDRRADRNMGGPAPHGEQGR